MSHTNQQTCGVRENLQTTMAKDLRPVVEVVPHKVINLRFSCVENMAMLLNIGIGLIQHPIYHMPSPSFVSKNIVMMAYAHEYFLPKELEKRDWFGYLGASHHVTPNAHLLHIKKPYACHSRVCVCVLPLVSP